MRILGLFGSLLPRTAFLAYPSHWPFAFVLALRLAHPHCYALACSCLL